LPIWGSGTVIWIIRGHVRHTCNVIEFGILHLGVVAQRLDDGRFCALRHLEFCDIDPSDLLRYLSMLTAGNAGNICSWTEFDQHFALYVPRGKL
jgi:hypothetical protein